MPCKMKVMEFEILLQFPLNQINAFVLEKMFLAVLNVYGPSRPQNQKSNFILKSTTQRINMDIYKHVFDKYR